MKKIFLCTLSFVALSLIMAACGDEPVFDENGALKGVFTVDENGKKVQFSRGNLQYHCKDKKWQFATNQWDTIGAANANFASDYDGWIDLFGWGTGDNPTNSTYSRFMDWGNNAISNGGDKPNFWHTLKGSEWDYLILQRNNAEKLVGIGTIDYVFGLILLPDDWDETAHPEFKAIGKLIWNQGIQRYEYEDQSDFPINIFTAQQWGLTMAKDGAVFLPAAGWRDGRTVKHMNILGIYQSASKSSTLSNYSARVEFSDNSIATNGYKSIYSGKSVRLVKNAE